MKRLITLSLLAFLTLPLAGQDMELFERKECAKEGYTLPYRILWPEKMKKGEKYPLFIFLHGLGMRGTDNEKQLDRGAPLFLDPANRKKYPCIALYPQAPTTSAFVEMLYDGEPGSRGGFRRFADREVVGHMSLRLTPYGLMVYDLIQQLIAQGVADTDRIYISGSSMGAFSTYTFISTYPDLFAAACPMAGGADLRTVKNWAGKVPVWIVHGAKDPTVPVEADRMVVEKLKELGATNYRYSEFPKAGHTSWNDAFAEPDYLEWFFSKSKSSK